MRSAPIRVSHAEPPESGQVIEVAAGVLWIRQALPLHLDHVNCYALEDDDGWTIVDAGIDDPSTRAAWESLLTGPLSAKAVRRLIITHHHPDHVGAAGWLLERTGARLIMTREEFLLALLRCRGIGEAANRAQIAFFQRHGLTNEILNHIANRDEKFAKGVAFLPADAQIVSAGETLWLAGRAWKVLIGQGHSPAQLLLHAPDEELFLGADQVLGTITPNIPVTFMEPEGNPLAEFLESLKSLKAAVGTGCLVLPGHKLPFYGLHERIDALTAHHLDTLDQIVEQCRNSPTQVPLLTENLFRQGLTPAGFALAASEVLAHLMALRNCGKVSADVRENGQVFWIAPAQSTNVLTTNGTLA